ncbi:adenylyltransferase/cytidyltransferase family protein [Streptomyces sp. BB1-1-1]
MVGDLFHPGHVALLRAARASGERLIAGVLSDKVVARYNRKPS